MHMHTSVRAYICLYKCVYGYVCLIAILQISPKKVSDISERTTDLSGWCSVLSVYLTGWCSVLSV